MKREIKFKVWDVKNQIMIHDALQLKKDCILQRVNLEERTSDDVVWLQFTGKKDCKGNKIYEGDIIEFDKREWGGNDNIHVVEWDNYNSEWSWGGGSTSDMDWRTVIGNVYENPELLTVNN